MTKSDVDSHVSVNPYQVDYQVELREPIKWSPAVLLLIFSVWCAVFGVCWLFARWDGAVVAFACIALSYFAISNCYEPWYWPLNKWPMNFLDMLAVVAIVCLVYGLLQPGVKTNCRPRRTLTPSQSASTSSEPIQASDAVVAENDIRGDDF